MSKRAIAPYLPSLGLIVVAVLGWIWLRADAAKIQLLIDSRQFAIPVAFAPSAFPDTADKSAALEKDLAELVGGADAGELALGELRAANAALEAQIPLESDEMVASFGRIADMGREVGDFMGTMEYSFRPPYGLPDDFDEEKAMMGLLKIFTWASDIGEMERNAQDIATFQSHGIAELLQLGEEEVASMHPILAKHFANIAAAELTVADRPAEDEEGDAEWRQGRGAALQNLMLELRPLLPETMPEERELAFAGVLNLGAAVSQKRGQFYISPWPEVPW